MTTDDALELLVEIKDLKRRLWAIERQLSQIIIQNGRTETGVTGMPCAGELTLNRETDPPIVQPAETHSCVIPPETVERIERGGE